MALTQITTNGIKDGTISSADLSDQSVTLAKLPHGTSSNDGKFLRANNGADPTFESLPASGLSNIVEDTTPQLGGALDTNGKNINFGDSTGGSADDRLVMGLGQDMAIYHDPSIGNLIKISSGEFLIRHYGENMIVAKPNLGVELYYDNALRLDTMIEGAKVKRHGGGSTTLYVEGAENASAILALYADDGDDNADKFRIQASSGGGLYFENYIDGAWETNIEFTDTKAVELYHDNSKKLETNGSGCHVTGSLTADTVAVQDNEKFLAGNNDDLEIFHNGSNSFILNATGEFQIANSGSGNAIFLQAKAGENAVKALANGAVELYHDNSKKFQTRASGVSVFDELSVGTADIQQSSVASFVGGQYNQVNIADGSNSGWGLLLAQQQGTNSSSLYTYSTNSSTNKPCSVVNVQNDALHFGTNNTARFRIEHDGHVLPSANNTYDLGSSSYRWRNIYTNDLNLSNEGGANDVDGTWGSYTIQEGHHDLFLINKRTGKKYKFNLTEVG